MPKLCAANCILLFTFVKFGQRGIGSCIKGPHTDECFVGGKIIFKVFYLLVFFLFSFLVWNVGHKP